MDLRTCCGDSAAARDRACTVYFLSLCRREVTVVERTGVASGNSRAARDGCLRGWLSRTAQLLARVAGVQDPNRPKPACRGPTASMHAPLQVDA